MILPRGETEQRAFSPLFFVFDSYKCKMTLFILAVR